MTISEKVAYLKGLAEGLGAAKEDTNEGKVLASVLDILSDLAMDVEDLDAQVEEIALQVDEIDEDLSDVEDALFDDDDDEFDEDDELYSVTCPNCHTDFEVSEEELLQDDGIECPSCGEKLTFEIEECDGECGSCEEDCDNRPE